ncbi:protein FAM114A2 isoform X2 [Sander lucioperca]|uniref:Family with sequence similarity 114 member A2 n=1 Tax=Sander lucioperca TaxID=283035 RepID=A0A8D0CPG1_SANLU|nr:protein FAM114A2 isoform X2 [Sander lucioperca]
MSDSEATAAEGPEVAPESQDASPTETPDSSSPTTPDISTDVAPTRKARRRPDVTPAAEAEETPKVEEKPAKAQTPSESTVSQGGWGYWGSWGKSILSTATATVATVGQGLTQVIEKAETSLGIPSPTELSAQVEEEQKEQGESSSETDKAPGDGSAAAGSAMGMLSSLTSVVQSTGKTMITGGLDALEFIGKKTMDVIAEGDPGFKKTKGLMNRNSTLSQVLREAKEREELQTAEKESSDSHKKAEAHYGMLFDEFQGLSHLEALEILSRDSESKVKSVLTTLSGEELLQLREELDLIKDSFSLVEFDDEDVDEKKDEDGSEFERELTEALEGLSVTATADKLSKACRSTCSQIADMSRPQEEEEEEESADNVKKTLSVEEVHAAAIRSLAELTARSIELFHKLAEMILFSNNGSTEASLLSQLTVVLCKEISLLSKKFTSCLTTTGSNEKGDVLNPLITGVFLEASNSASYIQDAFQLLMPILEISHIQRRAESTEQ